MQSYIGHPIEAAEKSDILHARKAWYGLQATLSYLPPHEDTPAQPDGIDLAEIYLDQHNSVIADPSV